MRLTPQQIAEIKSVAQEVWGSAVQVRLFGSRVDDARKGGDIDLYISGINLGPEAELDTKLRFLVQLKQRLGDQRIDVVFAPPPGQPRQPIQRVAESSGVPL